MRLIDADKFVKEEPTMWDWETVDGISATAVLKQCIHDVSCQPTVEAIPLDKSFLKMRYGKYSVYDHEWLKEHIDMEYSILKGHEYKKAIPIDFIQNWADKLYYGVSDLVCDKLIEDWRKENEH